jgi:hypothetical protein
MEHEKFIRDIVRISKLLPYIDVRKNGALRYVVSNPGIWTAHVDGGLTVEVNIGNSQLVVKDGILLDGEEVEELCLKNRCLSATGIKVRIGAAVLAYYSWLDALPVPYITRRRMLHYINNVEKKPEVAEFAIWALAARNALFEDAIDLATAIVEQIGKVRLAAYTART